MGMAACELLILDKIHFPIRILIVHDCSFYQHVGFARDGTEFFFLTIN